MDANTKPILKIGTIINDQWKVLERIGEGTFSQIYAAKSLKDGIRVAIKVEHPTGPLRNVLEWESCVLRAMQKFPFVTRYYYHGIHEGSHVLVMELLGENMSRMRQRAAMVGGLPLSVCVKVGIQMVDCLKGLHSLGYLHRDIKPSNFVHGLGRNQKNFYLIDFGLVRKFLDQEGKIFPPREKAEFRGTSMYASLNAHHEKELGCRDDLWSMFFVFLDLIRGELPWNREAHRKERDAIAQLKAHYTETAPQELVDGLPGAKGMLAFMDHLRSLDYADTPDYELLKDIFRGLLTEDEVVPSLESPAETVAVVPVKADDYAELTAEELARDWTKRTTKFLKVGADLAIYQALLEECQARDTFFLLNFENMTDYMKVQRTVYLLEDKLETLKSAPPPIIKSFGKKQEYEQKMRGEALRKRRERDEKVRLSFNMNAKRHHAMSPALELRRNGLTPGCTPISSPKPMSRSPSPVSTKADVKNEKPVETKKKADLHDEQTGMDEDMDMDCSDDPAEEPVPRPQPKERLIVAPARPYHPSANGDVAPPPPPPPPPAHDFGTPLPPPKAVTEQRSAPNSSLQRPPPPIYSPGGMLRPPPPPPPRQYHMAVGVNGDPARPHPPYVLMPYQQHSGHGSPSQDQHRHHRGFVAGQQVVPPRHSSYGHSSQSHGYNSPRSSQKVLSGRDGGRDRGRDGSRESDRDASRYRNKYN